MYIGTVLLLGIAANLDNLCIGISYGLTGKRIPWKYNLLMAGISGIFAYIACSVAALASHACTFIAVILGSTILIGFGLYAVTTGINGNRTSEEACQVREITLKEMSLLSVMLAFNCLPMSFGAGLSSVPALWLVGSTILFSVLFVELGNQLGARIGWLCQSKWLDILSGILLIIAGIVEFFL